MFDPEEFKARLQLHLAGGTLAVREAPMPTTAPAPAVNVTVESPVYRWKLTPARDPVTGLMTACIVEPVARVVLP